MKKRNLRKIEKIHLSEMEQRTRPVVVGKTTSSNKKPKINPNISKLNLSNKNLDKIPDEVINLKNLRKLNLSKNNLKSIPKDIHKLKRLENLDLSNNKLTSIYSNICKLTNLKVLILNNNQLKHLPSQIAKLQNLRILSVSGNNFKALPFYFQLLKKLESLNISNNRFSEFPEEIKSLKKLKRLWLNNNDFKESPLRYIINDLPTLKSLYCFHAVVDFNFQTKDSDLNEFFEQRGNILPSLERYIYGQDIDTINKINSFNDKTLEINNPIKKMETKN